MINVVTALKELTPLIQTLLWVFIVGAAAFILRRELATFLGTMVQRAAAGAPIEVGPIKLGELRAELSMVKTQVNDIGNKVTQLFLLTMSPAMFGNLRKLASGHFGPFEMSRGLERELYHLRDIGYVNVDTIKGIPQSGDDLSQHVRVTDAGRDFVRLRERIAT